MSFQSQEESTEQGSPIELFLFKNLENAYAFTSGNVPFTHLSREYVPRPIKRTEDEIETLGTDRTVSITLPADEPFLSRYVGAIPAQPDEVTIFRLHESDGASPEVKQTFKGEVASVGFENDGTATIAAKSNAAKLRRLIPKQSTRNLCNHVLYDSRCQVVAENFRFDVTVVAVSSDEKNLTVTGSGISSQLASDATFFNLGTIEREGLERRMVRGTTDLGSDQAVITVLFPFSAVGVGQALRLFAGCDHQFPTCRDKFANQDRYGGFPFVPRRNIFRVGVK